MKKKEQSGRVDSTVGFFIKKRREKLGLSRRELAQKLGYKWPTFISMLENGAAQFPVHKWREYADVLSTPRHQFLRLVLATYFPEMLPYVVFRDGQ